MNKLRLLLFGTLVLTGCNNNSSLTYSELSEEDLSEETQSYFQSVKKENGAHLYFDEENDSMVVYLNGENIVQGEKAETFTGFDVDSEEDILKLMYKSEETTDFSDSSSDYSLFYKVNLNKEYDKVKLFQNGNEASFLSISGGVEE
ncbi:hypothetical protein [Sutcliffiella horikoshii]|uniref:Uncharacterized protein n=1 Tax=Sutcliffiella horikoshii TaxID=79883 RepID=A0A5D4T7K8_9BACI|nr:hypothetical protein [Sutcliffiella horikoshii]TYS71700.1 hypothetical protein FZC75_11070 [Sutcliffiella horikoshii]